MYHRVNEPVSFSTISKETFIVAGACVLVVTNICCLHRVFILMAGYEVSTECVKVILQISITNKMCYLVDDATLH